jgi:uncharacterized protein YbjT (DUF2867 family)
MKILLTGTTGYIGKRLLPILISEGHQVVCCVRDIRRFQIPEGYASKIEVIELDFLDRPSLKKIPEDIDAAYYLIHSMSTSIGDFETLEEQSARNFKDRLEQTSVKQVIYLSGIVNEEKLSKHLSSRKKVESVLASNIYHLTTLRAGIIIGSGSDSFEIMRDLVEKLPVMVTPKWLNTRSQPIAIRNVLEYLKGVLYHEKTFNQSYDIGGPEILTYKEMLLQFAKVRKLKRRIYTVPVMTPKLSSYWLYFVTSTSYKLAVNLVNSMKIEVICGESDIDELVEIELLSYAEAVELAFEKIVSKDILSSWKDAQSSSVLFQGITKLVEVPTYGCFSDKQTQKINDEQRTLSRIWAIGGDNGWYYANWLWGIRGFVDKLVGGVGLRRGRTNIANISAGDALDFWRVLYANKEEKRLLLYAEMKLPGEAWLEFKLEGNVLCQTATFRPLGLWGRIYWYLVLPFHGFIFKGMINKLSI